MIKSLNRNPDCLLKNKFSFIPDAAPTVSVLYLILVSSRDFNLMSQVKNSTLVLLKIF